LAIKTFQEQKYLMAEDFILSLFFVFRGIRIINRDNSISGELV